MEDFLTILRNDHHNFDKGKISDHVPKDPNDFFNKWYKEAFQSTENEPNAMVLSTVNEEHKPSSRILYLKELNQDGFIFFTNYNSHKGKDLLHNKNASLLFFWPTLERQVRIEGTVEKTSSSISDEYFESRPKESQLGAWASHQSDYLESRIDLENRLKSLMNEYPEKVPRPQHWGGYVLKALRFEFWQGRPSRLHDRIIYENQGHNWIIHRLNP